MYPLSFADHQSRTNITIFSETYLSDPEFNFLIGHVLAGNIPKTQVASQRAYGAMYECFVVNLQPDWKITLRFDAQQNG